VLLALGISTLLYTLTAVAAVSVLGVDRLAASERPLADVVEHALSADAGSGIAIVAMVATASTALLMLTSLSRIVYAMAATGFLPAATGAVHPERRVPVRAIVAGGVAAIVFVAFGRLATIAAATDALVLGVFVAVNVALIVLRFTRPEAPRPFRLRLSIARAPLTAAAAAAVAVIFIARLDLDAIAIAAGLCGAGAGAHAVLQRRQP
jgi:APA family basic amino acid/polyamine antiporter